MASLRHGLNPSHAKRTALHHTPYCILHASLTSHDLKTHFHFASVAAEWARHAAATATATRIVQYSLLSAQVGYLISTCQRSPAVVDVNRADVYNKRPSLKTEINFSDSGHIRLDIRHWQRLGLATPTLRNGPPIGIKIPVSSYNLNGGSPLRLRFHFQLTRTFPLAV
jgi:hypothetical protein